ncbi:MAG: FKBP-type peptidyl-prolyl cis-trans isomerase [Flavobacteriales bacterium]|nr:FKBP-type peptidyl-prolyl cis-trans isomerase [Flavobacteriales bacterium]
MKHLILCCVLVLAGCNGCSEKKDVPGHYTDVQAHLIEANKKKHADETLRIKEFITENKWPMQETSSGLHYWIYEDGGGEQATLGKRASLKYVITLFDGTECYRADENNPGTFVIGQDNVETGLHEMVQLMRVGDKAKVILPSHLAFGLTGDSAKIPRDASLVYDIQLLALN